MKYINIVFIIFTINFGLTLNAQVNESLADNIFENKSFETNQIIGIKNFEYNTNVANIELYELNPEYPYGNITTFNNGKFTSGNIGPCGNECRITVLGNYSIKENQIYLFLETITFWKDCKNNPIQQINKEIGTFIWEKDEKGKINLTAQK